MRTAQEANLRRLDTDETWKRNGLEERNDEIGVDLMIALNLIDLLREEARLALVHALLTVDKLREEPR